MSVRSHVSAYPQPYGFFGSKNLCACCAEYAARVLSHSQAPQVRDSRSTANITRHVLAKQGNPMHVPDAGVAAARLLPANQLANPNAPAAGAVPMTEYMAAR
jgi:hypothetical protein